MSSLERMAIDLAAAVSAQERRLEDSRAEVRRLQSLLEDAQDNLLNAEDEAILELEPRFAHILDHLVNRTGIFDLSDLERAGVDAGYL